MTHVDHFLAEPLPSLPARRPGSVRRTSHVDMIGMPDGTLELRGAAVDPGGGASCTAVVGTGRALLALQLAPEVPGGHGLIGRVVGRGFRAAVDQLCPPGSLPSVLLSELPVAALLSGYGSLYSGLLPGPLTDQFLTGLPIDVCAGWASPGSLMVQVRGEREIPTPNGPEAPRDETGWHEMPLLAAGSMRRQRLLERAGDEVWAMFRDTYARPDGVTTVLHEYTLEATVTDPGDGSGARVATCRATPRVLPWTECPQAAGSAERLVGKRVADLGALVRHDLVGTSTCTHLNDLLSSLAQVDQLVGPGAESPARGRAR